MGYFVKQHRQVHRKQVGMKKKKFLQMLREVRTTKGRHYHQCFSIEGYRLIERALGSRHRLHSVLVAEQSLSKPNEREKAILLDLERAGCPTFSATSEEMEELIEGRTFGPMVGLVPTLPPADLSSFLAQERCTFLVLVHAKDPGNLGALMRTGRASGADAMLLVGGTDPFHPKAARTSMGAIFDLPILSNLDGEHLLEQLHKAQVQSIGAVVLDGTPPYQQEISNRRALFMGSEAHGLPAQMQSQFDVRWSIPMQADIDSFSINAATSILMYELNRRTWCAPKE